MKIVSYLLRTSARDISAVALVAMLGGASSAALIAVVNASLHERGSRALLAGGFALILVVRIICSLVSNRMLVRLSQGAVLTMYERLCCRIAATPYRQLEEIGSARIFACLTDDVNVLSGSIQAIPALAVNVAILTGCALYLAWLSWPAAVVLLILVAAGSAAYKLLLTRVYEAFRRTRAGRDRLFGHFRGLTEGMKELQLNRARREAFLSEDIGSTIAYLRDQGIVAMNLNATADAWSQLVFYALLGMLLFVLPLAHGITPEALTAYVFTALYVATPIWGVIGGLPVFTRGEEALKRLNDLGLSLGVNETSIVTTKSPTVPPSSLQFRDVTFTYPATKGSDGFTLGPLDLELKAGELVFVIGGNGSGKSTFVKLLTGLYAPTSGTIALDGKPVSEETQERYREHFSAVYSDFFLFDRLHGVSTSQLALKSQHYLSALQLQHKVRIDGDRFSTTSLSQGQRRRLALLTAYLEDRPIYVLDEWAADQDPSFRQVFYTQLLPELKRKGKTVVVITHDDRYFHLGDRIIKLEYGQIVETAVTGMASAGLVASVS